MNGEEFERAYADRGGMTVAELRGLGRVVLPCDCAEERCEGWQSLSSENAVDELKLWRPWERHEGWVCKGCSGWIDPGTDRVTQTIPGPEWRNGVLTLHDGVEIARMAVFHERCAPAMPTPALEAP